MARGFAALPRITEWVARSKRNAGQFERSNGIIGETELVWCGVFAERTADFKKYCDELVFLPREKKFPTESAERLSDVQIILRPTKYTDETL